MGFYIRGKSLAPDFSGGSLATVKTLAKLIAVEASALPDSDAPYLTGLKLQYIGFLYRPSLQIRLCVSGDRPALAILLRSYQACSWLEPVLSEPDRVTVQLTLAGGEGASVTGIEVSDHYMDSRLFGYLCAGKRLPAEVGNCLKDYSAANADHRLFEFEKSERQRQLESLLGRVGCLVQHVSHFKLEMTPRDPQYPRLKIYFAAGYRL